MNDSARVLVSVVDRVAHVRLNRASKRNGLDHAMFTGLIDAGLQVAEDPSVRAVVLSGEGPCFCAGLDFQAFLAMPDGPELLLHRGPDSPANVAQRAAWVWREVPAPVIAAVHGVCFGGGLQIALGADLRIVHPEAQLSVMEIKWGLMPDMGLSKTLLSVTRLDVAKELTFTGRRISGVEALALGLATRLSDDPVATALEAAAAIADRNPAAIVAAKRLLDAADDLDTAAAFALETALQRPLLGSANQMEAVAANLQRRPPVFQDRS